MVRALYTTSYRLILYLILGTLPLFIALTPLISRLWIGTYTDAFILFADLLFVGWFLNMLSNPAYFAYLGIGVLRWNVAGHLVIGLLNGLLGVVLGWLYGATGVVVGFVIALILGSLVIALSYQRTYQIRLADLMQRESAWLGGAALAGMALALWVHHQLSPSWSLFGLIVVVPGLYGILVIAPLWRHPARRQLQAWLTTLFVRRSSHPTHE
jgi:hypothetical protein